MIKKYLIVLGALLAGSAVFVAAFTPLYFIFNYATGVTQTILIVGYLYLLGSGIVLAMIEIKNKNSE